MDKLPVGQLPDLQQSNNDDEIMVITDSEHNQLKKEKISDLITDFTSTDENNALAKGTDGKMFVTDFGNASNITEGTLPTSVLPEIPLEKIPDIPKSKLPDIETSDLPVSGVSADTYAYPSSVTVNAQGQVTAIEEGTPSASNANVDLSNITEAGKEVIKNIVNENEIELNNPFFFGMSQYFDVEPNNLSWLKSDGMYKPKSVYPDYYNWILENVNKGVEGFKGQEGYCFIATVSSSYYCWVSTESPVVGASVYRYDAGVNSMFFDGTVEILTSNGFTFTSIFEGSSYTVTRDSSKDTSILHPAAWITDNDFVINTPDETFRLPLKNGTEGMFGGGAVVGNGHALGLTSTGSEANTMFTSYNAPNYGTAFTNKYSSNSLPFIVGAGALPNGQVVGVTTNPDKSGLVVANAGVVPDGWALYYYVGETVQNANLIDAGSMQEQITNINAPSRGYLVQSYVNGTSGYRVYSDGWCEQWGRIPVGQDAAVWVTFLKPFMNASYYANWISCNGETLDGQGTRACDNLTTTSMRIYNGQDRVMLANWYTCGY